MYSRIYIYILVGILTISDGKTGGYMKTNFLVAFLSYMGLLKLLNEIISKWTWSN